MTRITISFELGQRISSTLSIVLILLLSVLVALLTLRTAQNIIDMAQYSPAFHIENRVNSAPDQLDTQSSLTGSCAKDMKVCSDGSIVKRVAPYCDFAPCLKK
ncbi:MAG: hypothetical protein WBC29_03305 [Candidatus Moraniibacteriota bacterium]